MVEDAEKFRQSDMELKEKLEARSGLDNYLYSIRTQLTDDSGIGKKIDETEKNNIMELIKAKTKWMDEHKDSASKEDFEEQKAEVEKAFAPIISKIYQQEGGPAADDAGSKVSDHEEL
jgi:heat shock protein 5